MATVYGTILRHLASSDPESSTYQALRAAQVIDVTPIGEYYHHSEKGDWSIAAGDFPNIAPIYPVTFFQWRQPRDYIYVSVDPTEPERIARQENPDPEDYGILLQASRLSEAEKVQHAVLPEVHWGMRLRTFFLLPQENKAGWFPWDLSLACDRYGQPTDIQPERQVILHPHNEETHQQILEIGAQPMINMLFGLAHVAFLATSFLHCKNVTIVEETAQMDRAAKRRFARQRGGEPFYRYHTLDIKPMRRVIRRAGGESESGQLRSLHMVRGHFKHFGPWEESNHPGQIDTGLLFGKHAGMYYWEPFARGRAEVGRVDKDYRVHPPEEE